MAETPSVRRTCEARRAGCPTDRVRAPHLLGAIIEGPHCCRHRPWAPLFPLLLMRVCPRPLPLLFENAPIPGTAHEMEPCSATAPRATDFPSTRCLVPRAVDTTTNFIEHPDLGRPASGTVRGPSSAPTAFIAAKRLPVFGTFAGSARGTRKSRGPKLATLLRKGARARRMTPASARSPA